MRYVIAMLLLLGLLSLKACAEGGSESIDTVDNQLQARQELLART